LIVDKKSDLNIYKERNHGEEVASCCGTAEKKEPAANSSCCAPAATCCSASSEKVSSEKEELAKRVANIDFNEWVSECILFLRPCFTGSNAT
jgi:arsenite methyltransferase